MENKLKLKLLAVKEIHSFLKTNRIKIKKLNCEFSSPVKCEDPIKTFKFVRNKFMVMFSFRRNFLNIYYKGNSSNKKYTKENKGYLNETNFKEITVFRLDSKEFERTKIEYKEQTGVSENILPLLKWSLKYVRNLKNKMDV